MTIVEEIAAQEAGSGVDIVPVHPSKVGMVWDQVYPWLEKSLEHGDGLYSSSDILDHILSQAFILWVAVKDEQVVGMCITSLDEYPQKTVASIRWTGGKPHAGRDWLLPMLEELKRWGKHFGASLLVGGGRKGWLRGPYGFKESQVIFEQEIT